MIDALQHDDDLTSPRTFVGLLPNSAVMAHLSPSILSLPSPDASNARKACLIQGEDEEHGGLLLSTCAAGCCSINLQKLQKAMNQPKVFGGAVCMLPPGEVAPNPKARRLQAVVRAVANRYAALILPSTQEDGSTSFTAVRRTRWRAGNSTMGSLLLLTASVCVHGRCESYYLQGGRPWPRLLRLLRSWCSLVPASPSNNMDPTAGVRGQSSSGLAYRGESSYGEEESSHDPAASSGSVAFQQPPYSQVKQYENTAEFHQQKLRAAAPNQPYLNNKNTSSSSSAMSHHNNKQPADPQDAANAWVMYQDKSGHFYWQ